MSSTSASANANAVTNGRLRADLEAGEGTPLLSSAGEPAPLQEMKAESLKERAVAGTAAVSCVTSVLAVLFEATSHPTVWVSGILGAVLAPYAALQQRKLTQTEALHQTNERMAQEVEQLTAENGRLSKQVKEMEETVINLQAMEETLETLQSVQGISVDQLETQLQESREILKSMDRNLQSEIVRNLVTIMLAADTDKDYLLSDGEIDDIIHKLEAIHGVQLKEDQLRQIVISQGRSIKSLMHLARNLMQESDPDQNIFMFIEDDDALEQ